jgi:hypothetical protein
MYNRLIKNKIGLREARSSLNRVTYLLENYNTGLLTGYRKVDRNKVSPADTKVNRKKGIYNLDFNKDRNLNIKAILKNEGLSWIDVGGTYIEDGKIVRKRPNERIDIDNRNPENYEIMGKKVYEKSLLVIDHNRVLTDDEFSNLIEQLGIDHFQESVVINIQGKNPLLLGTNDSEYLKKGDFFDLTDRKGGEKFISYNSKKFTIYSELSQSVDKKIDDILSPSKKKFTIGSGLPLYPTEEEMEMSDEEHDIRRADMEKNLGIG